MSGKLVVIGFGPGSKDDMTLRAVKALDEADIITGFTTYVKILQEFFPDKPYKSTGMTKEVDRCRMAVEEASKGKNVALVSSGDSGIYGMAGIAYQVADEMDADIEIEIIPGITAASSAAAILGAPLTHDTALISLSNRLTPWELIEKRLDAAAASDMVIALYNPKSHGRPDLIEKAFKIMGKHKDSNTVVGVVRNIGRKDQDSWISSMKDFDFSKIDMFCTVVIGNSKTYALDGKMITPRGYDVGGE